MRKLNERQREVLAEKFADLGNISIGSLVFGFVLQSNVLNGLSLFIGLGIAFATYGISISLQK
ncbi:MAG: hypothetical protein HY617_04045 [Candidatus Sungbacteria bacterium]|nr:hypothetical protein [Candidatus Sungbacteria bacterium]